MRKQIRGELFKMLVVVVMLVGITLLAWDFVITGIKAKVLLNGSIIAVFIFGIYLCFRNTLALKNEEVAFSALVEAYEDIKRTRLKSAEDPYWRHYRCLEPGTVFGRPHLLGHFFEMVYDEMFRSRKLKVSVETMGGLVHGVESRLKEERSAIAFMTGLLVFMGLIGAFIGLIQMVQSVGELVGSLANAGGGAGGMSKLITDLQGPLKGMSVGFSSSLFGLFGSMTLGLMNQFSGHAGTILKTEFEAWLASAAQIDEEAEHDDKPEQPAIEALAAAAAGFGKVNASFDQVAKLVGDVARLQSEQGEALARTTKVIEEMGRRHEELAQLVAASGAVGPALVGAQQEMIAASRGVELRLVDGFDKLERGLASAQRAQSEQLREIADTGARTSAITIAAIEMGANRQVEAIDKLAARQAIGAGDPAMASRLEAGMTHGFTEVARAIETSFLAYARLVENAVPKPAAAAPHDVAARPEPKPMPMAVGQDFVPPPAAPDAAPQVDAAEMLRRLQSAVSKQYSQS